MAKRGRMAGYKHTPESIEKMRQSKKGQGGRSGPENPFYGRKHTPEALEKNRLAHLGKASGNQYAKGYQHTTDARARISAAMKRLWQKRQANPSAYPTIPMHPERMQGIRKRQLPRGRWNPSQQRNWKGDRCVRCGSTERLELDHIIPRFLGGKNVKSNAQTLCAPCNIWKMWHIDMPQYQALQAMQGAK